jgi:hypothetical protein
MTSTASTSAFAPRRTRTFGALAVAAAVGITLIAFARVTIGSGLARSGFMGSRIAWLGVAAFAVASVSIASIRVTSLGITALAVAAILVAPLAGTPGVATAGISGIAGAAAFTRSTAIASLT